MEEKCDIREIIKNKDEKKLKEEVIDIFKKAIKNPEIKSEISYWESYMITIPLELGRKTPWVVKDKILDDALFIIANFEGDNLEEAKKKSRKILAKLNKTT